jgi:hypothetical protein
MSCARANHSRARAGRRLLAALLACSLADCGYQSQYAPPNDGRARVLWHDDHLINNVATMAPSDECHRATWWLRNPNEEPSDRRLSIAPVVWVPRYYGADIVVITPGVPPAFPRPLLFSPSLAVAQAASRSVPKLSLDKELAAILLVIAVVVLPVVDVTFAALRPESDSRSADAIDEVNAFNDLARSAGTPCSQ